MNTTFFGLKRAFHSTLRLTREPLASLGLTAARFDLLYVVLKEGRSMVQRDLREALGVSGATVSRMLKSLEELGLLEREPFKEDRRYRSIRLTKAGRRCIRQAIRHFVRSGLAQLALDSALKPDAWWNKVACANAVTAIDETLRRMRDAYGDVATPHYPHAHEDGDRHWWRVPSWLSDLREPFC